MDFSRTACRPGLSRVGLLRLCSLSGRAERIGATRAVDCPTTCWRVSGVWFECAVGLPAVRMGTFGSRSCSVGSRHLRVPGQYTVPVLHTFRGGNELSPTYLPLARHDAERVGRRRASRVPCERLH